VRRRMARPAGTAPNFSARRPAFAGRFTASVVVWYPQSESLATVP
jgi:hypothetical protein